MHKPHVAIILATLLAGGTAAAGEPEGLLTRPMPMSWADDVNVSQTLPEDDNWWRGFDDPTLDSLIVGASTSNFNLLEAYHRREMARNAMLQARSAYWPQLSANASYARERTQRLNTNTYSLGAQMNWEIDVFGKVREAVKAKKASYRASKAEYTGAMVSMAADMATYYMDYRITQTHLATYSK